MRMFHSKVLHHRVHAAATSMIGLAHSISCWHQLRMPDTGARHRPTTLHHMPRVPICVRIHLWYPRTPAEHVCMQKQGTTAVAKAPVVSHHMLLIN